MKCKCDCQRLKITPLVSTERIIRYVKRILTDGMTRTDREIRAHIISGNSLKQAGVGIAVCGVVVEAAET